jgi:hypothetical protein
MGAAKKMTDSAPLLGQDKAPPGQWGGSFGSGALSKQGLWSVAGVVAAGIGVMFTVGAALLLFTTAILVSKHQLMTASTVL